MKVLISIAVYIIIAAVVTFALFVASMKNGVYDPEYDAPWPIFCGIGWPLAGSIAAAFIAANWFLNSKK